MAAHSTHLTIHSVATKKLAFSKSTTPLLHIESGDQVVFDNRHATFPAINEQTTDEDLVKLNVKGLEDLERVMGPIYVDGPVYVNGAEPGDTLKIEILELETGSWGWQAIFPGLGLLQDKFPGPHIKTFKLDKASAIFKPGVVIPAAPFYGTMGVAPASDEELNPLFPRNDIGGNFDCRYLGVGSTFFLNVNVPGALFSVGDAHFCQGDGEITGTALETTMKGTLRLSVMKKGGLQLQVPHYVTDPTRTAAMHAVAGQGEHGTLATARTRDEAVKTAVLNLLEWLSFEKGLTEIEAYMLFSMTGNLKMMHDLGLELYTVSASIPLGLFQS